MDVLRSETLKKLPPEVAVPEYDRKTVSPGIIHFGVGNFHRAHFAPLIDNLMRQEDQRAWGISGVGLLPRDRGTRDSLREQDHLYSLTMKHPDGARDTRIVGSIVEMFYRRDAYPQIIDRIANPSTQIISMTITEGGYKIDEATGEFMLEDPDVKSDLQNMDAPGTVFGVVCAGLRERMNLHGKPISILSCDNILGNGEISRKAFTSFAAAWDEKLVKWMTASVSFPNSMVDRITPVTSSVEMAQINEYLGVNDSCSVVSEPFWQFIVEDRFAGDRPAWERTGVQLVTDIHPYEATKLQLLNGSHQLLAQFGLLLNMVYVHEALADKRLERILMRFMLDEVEPTLPETNDFDVPSYELEIRSRFSNAEIADTLDRIATNSSDRIQKFILPTVSKNLENGRPIDICGAVIAAWIWRIASADPAGSLNSVSDGYPSDIRTTTNGVSEFLKERKLFGELASSHDFREAVGKAVRRLQELGPEKYFEELAATSSFTRRS